MDDFKICGYMAISNSASYVLELSPNGDAARYRILSSSITVAKGKWQEVRWSLRKGPYIKDWHGNKPKGAPSRTYKRLYLNDFMTYR